MSSRPSLRLLAALTTSAFVSVPAVALACGGGVSTETAADLGIAQHVAYYALHADGQTDVVVQLAVPGADQPFGVILPVRGAPTLDDEPVDSGELQRLSDRTAPRIIEEDLDGGSSGSSDSGCGCGEEDLGGGDLEGGAGGGAANGRDPGYDVIDVAEIGPVSAVAFSADDGDGLDAWLEENEFVLPEAARRTLDAYVTEGFDFIAFQRSDDAPQAQTAVGVHFTLDEPYDGYALRMASVGAAEELAILTFVASADGARAPASPFVTFTLDDLRADLIRNEGYGAAVRAAVSGTGGRAFVVEGVFDGQDALRNTSRLATMTPADATVTRLVTIMPRDALDADVAFSAPFTDEAPTEIYLTIAALGRPRPVPVKWGSVGVFVGAGLTAYLRRRRRSTAEVSSTKV